MPLSDLRPGETGVVTGWVGGSPPTRLLEMGLLEGTEVELVRFAPLGDPVDLKVRGYHMSIRLEQARLVVVARAR
jgi:Fe2+ transport system protein FeoA